MAENNEPTYTKPGSEEWADRVADEDYTPDSVLVQGDDPAKSPDGFVAVDPIYRNFSTEQRKPYTGDEGGEAKLEEQLFADDVDRDAGATPEGEGEEIENMEGEAGGSPSTATSNPEQVGTPPPPAQTQPSN